MLEPGLNRGCDTYLIFGGLGPWEAPAGRQDGSLNIWRAVGDGVGTLMWRLLDGELPTGWSPKVIVLSVGTSDLEGQTCKMNNARLTASHLRSMINYILKQHPSTYIVYSAILPKGGRWPNMCSEAIKHVNNEMQRFSQQVSRLTVLDIGKIFINREIPGEPKISESLMPDSMHPNKVGATIMAYQLRKVLRKQLGLQIHEGEESLMLANPGWANLLRGLPY
eukprot:jgi/Botrbrau1/11922/Bobra.0259s0011.1